MQIVSSLILIGLMIVGYYVQAYYRHKHTTADTVDAIVYIEDIIQR